MFVVIVTHLVTQPMTPCHLTWRWVLTLKGQCAGARLYRLGPTWTTAGVGDVDDRDDDPDQHVEITRVPSCGVVRSRRRRYAPPLARLPRRALPWCGPPGASRAYFSSANIDRHGSTVRVRLVPPDRHVIVGRGVLVCLVLVRVPHPLSIVSTGDGQVNPA